MPSKNAYPMPTQTKLFLPVTHMAWHVHVHVHDMSNCSQWNGMSQKECIILPPIFENFPSIMNERERREEEEEGEEEDGVQNRGEKLSWQRAK